MVAVFAARTIKLCRAEACLRRKALLQAETSVRRSGSRLCHSNAFLPHPPSFISSADQPVSRYPGRGDDADAATGVLGALIFRATACPSFILALFVQILAPVLGSGIPVDE